MNTKNNITRRLENTRFKDEMRNLKDHHVRERAQVKDMMEKDLEILKQNKTDQKLALAKDIDAQKMEYVENHEKKLGQLKESFDKTKETLDRELEIHKKTHQDQLVELDKNHQDQFHRKVATKNYTMDRFNRKFQGQMQDLHDQEKFDRNALVRASNKRIQKLEDIQENKLSRKHDVYKSALHHMSKKHQESLAREQQRNLNELSDVKYAHYKKIETQNKVYKDELEKLGKTHTQLLEEAKKEFQQKYNSVKEKYHQDVQYLTDRSQNLTEQLKRDLSSNLNSTLTKAQDTFYRPRNMEPVLEDTGKHYLIHLQLPEHEKDFVQLSSNVRDVTITFSRRFEDKVKEGDKTMTETFRTESYRKVFNVPEIVDDSKVEKSYQDGVLTYQIAKK